MPLHSPETPSLIRSHLRNIFPRDVRTSSREDCRKSCLAVQEVGPASSGGARGPTRPDGYKTRTETLPPLAQRTRPMPPSPALRIAQPLSAPQTWSSVLGILRRCARARSSASFGTFAPLAAAGALGDRTAHFRTTNATRPNPSTE